MRQLRRKIAADEMKKLNLLEKWPGPNSARRRRGCIVNDNWLAGGGEFAVFGDQIVAQPSQNSEPIGEASVRTANGLGIPSSPATGGVGGGVTYIAFVGTGSQPVDMENIPEVQSLGAQLTESLLQNNP